MTEYRTYASLVTARKAIKAKELDEEPVRYDAVFVDGRTERRVMPVVIVGSASDRREVEDLGFKAEMRDTDFRIGSSVTLHPSVLAVGHAEIARIEKFYPNTERSPLKLDRPIGGTVWWDAEELVLV